MHWKIIVSRAGAEAAGMPDPSDWADLLSPETDLSSAVPPEDGRCPRCHRQAVECLWQIFADEPATTPDQVTGSIFVKCLCRKLYRYAGIHAVDAHRPVGEAVVRAASAPRPVTPPQPIGSELPPGAGNTIDAETQVVLMTYEHRGRFHAATSFITPPFGPVRARDPLR
jgi:hypothetical protein